MNSSKPTLSIYAIQDRLDSETPYFVHDHGITLMDQGKIIKHLTFERTSRNKHDNKLQNSLYDILKGEGLLHPDDYDLVFPDNVVGRSVISKCGRLRFEAPLSNTLLSNPEKGRCWWLDHERDAYAINHELAHIGSCLPFYGGYKEDSLLIHFDGGGSLSNFSAWHYKDGKVQNIEFHWKFKYLSSFFNANPIVFGIIGAKYNQQNSVPGKMMGLASYGSYNEKIECWLKQNNYFANLWGKKGAFYQSAQKEFGWKGNQLHTNDSFLQDIVATMQFIFIREFTAELKILQQQTSARHLYYTGGSALNIVANKHIVDANIFEDVFIPPCTEDSGLSLGSAAYVEFLKHGNVAKHSPYQLNWGLSNTATSLNDIPQIAKALSEGKVIGVCNGAAECGPRALGNRSILALANSKKLAKKVSEEHKGREWYRPVAPIMLEKNALHYTGGKSIHNLADLMLLDFDIQEDKQNEIEGVVHVDGTARIQTIRSKDQNPFMFDLLSYLDSNYNCKALINTSFNKRGEPIVHSHQDAVKSAKNMNLDGVVLDGKLQLF
ncbi:carbamoyltransferase C-terminal domain-containing protein [Saccharicrinis aurantiacus]|uniref:carbamoyltransferase C-terminal domain-containing protein n=1 Tax=Saccharicrinis aurantiacus TaxID=1849719 RepID=UPI0024933F45|nr:carbamoyltransferase C-terminal domain-containing protein [Saccharicrinis aurantiacus]